MKDMLDDIPDDQLRKRLQNFKEEPDDQVWQNLQGAMKNEKSSLTDRLKQYQEEPEAATWEKVASGVRAQKVSLRFENLAVTISVIALMLLLYPVVYDRTVAEPGNMLLQIEGDTLNWLKPEFNLPGDNKLLSMEPPNAKENTTTEKELRKANGKQSSGSDLNISGMNHSESKRRGKIMRKDLSQGVQSNDAPQVLTGKESAEKVTVVRSASSIFDTNQSIVDSRTPIEVVNNVPEILNREIPSENSNNESSNVNHVVQPLVDSATAYVKSSDGSGETAEAQFARVESKLPATETNSLKPTPKVARTNVVSQSKEKRAEDKKRLTSNSGFYALLMPTLGYQQIKPIEDDDIFIQSVERLSAFSPKRLGVRGEIGYERIKSRWGMHVGLLYYQRKQTISYYYNQSSEVEVVKLPGDTLAYSVEPTPLFSTYQYQVKNIGMLLGINYNIQGKTFTQRIGVSGELHKPVSSSGDSMYFFANVYYRIAHKLGNRFDLMLQPTFNYALQVDSRVSAPFYVKPYGLGLNFGVYYHLNTGK
jgi:hypothetical protein